MCVRRGVASLIPFRVAEKGFFVAIIVDGYNVIFSKLEHPLKPESNECERLRTVLLERLANYAEYMDEAVTVVFDGGEAGAHLARRQHHRGITVIFSDPDSDADTEIKQLVRASDGARDLRIVTDDRDIAQHVRRLGAKIVDVDTLLRKVGAFEKKTGERPRLAEPPQKYEGPADYEVDDWVRLFEEPDEDDEEGLDA